MENRNWWSRPELNRRSLSAALPVCCSILPVFPGCHASLNAARRLLAGYSIHRHAANTRGFYSKVLLPLPWRAWEPPLTWRFRGAVKLSLFQVGVRIGTALLKPRCEPGNLMLGQIRTCRNTVRTYCRPVIVRRIFLRILVQSHRRCSSESFRKLVHSRNDLFQLLQLANAWGRNYDIHAAPSFPQR